MKTDSSIEKRRPFAAMLAAMILLSVLCAVSASAAQAQGKAKVVVPSIVLPATPVMEMVESGNDASTLTIYAEFEPQGWSFHRVYLDTDNNPATGFSVDTIQNGAEFLVEGQFIYRYTGTGRNWSWQGLGTVPFELGARSARWRIARSTIGESASPNVTGFRIHLQTAAGAGADSGLYLHHYPWQTSPTAQQLGIPAYIWYGDTATWQRLLASDPLTLDLVVFVGPDNGPGTVAIPQLAGHINTARRQGRRALGYVDTNYGQRSLTDVFNDIDRYYAWYRVNGIFIDQADPTCNRVAYYTAIRNRVLAKGADQRVVLNPGTKFEECMMPTADIFMSFETNATNYLNTPTASILPAFADKYPRSRFWHVVHGATPAQLSAVVARSKQLYVGRLWVTNDADLNVYDSFPEASFYNALAQSATEQASPAANVRRPYVPPKRIRPRKETNIGGADVRR
ncbi:MAG: spherulation-specific family 4 protein [Pseudomonadota bacterium]